MISISTTLFHNCSVLTFSVDFDYFKYLIDLLFVDTFIFGYLFTFISTVIKSIVSIALYNTKSDDLEHDLDLYI